jgi:hypothetical protein
MVSARFNPGSACCGNGDLNVIQGILNEVWKNKLIFVETPDANETSIALENYRRVCSPYDSLNTRCSRLMRILGL